MSQGWQKHLSFGQAKYTAGIMHLRKAADYLCKALMVVSPSPLRQRKCWYFGSLRVHLLAVHTSVTVSQGTVG